MRNKLLNSPFTYALGMLAMMIPSQAFSSFYNYYYVEKLGLGLAFATVARTIFLIWDAVNQPLFGYLSDKTNTKYGRRRPWIIGAIPLFMLFFIMVFAVPHGMSDAELFVWLLVALILYEAVASIIWVNYGALFPELFQGDRKRAKASAIQQMFQIIALLIASTLAPVLYTAIGYGSMAVIFALVFAAIMILFVRNIQEDEKARQTPTLPLKEAFRATLSNKPFWLYNISNSFAQTVNGLLSSIIPFYAKYVLHIPEAQVSILLASIFVSVIPLVGVWYWIMKKMNLVNGWRLSLLVYGLAVIPLWFGHNLITGILAGIVAGFGLAGFLVTPPVVSSRIIDIDAHKTGRRREGIYTAVGGFINRSSGLISAVAFLIVGVMFGYKSGDDPGPNPAETFRVLISVVPCILLAISVLVSSFVKLRDPRE